MPTSTTYIYIFGENETKVWGLNGQERLKRMVKANEQATLIENAKEIPATELVLFLSASHLFDPRVLAVLIDKQEKMVLLSNEKIPAAIRIDGLQAQALLKELASQDKAYNMHTLSALPPCSLEDLNIDFQQNLKKKDPPYLLPITSENSRLLEKELFSGSYKGVTDLVTKWVWPMPAFWSTHFCVRHGWQPNHVTYLSVVFAVFAGVAFWYGFFAMGLLMGWFMTFLDTVDGKLARVTVTSSRLGDVLDHGLDIIHPPLWYLAWGIGLAAASTPMVGLEILMWLMLLGYVGGRLCEGAFLWMASFDMFIWHKIDSYNRLITARRNPNLLLLSFGWLIDQPGLGLLLVVSWHLISTGILTVRLFAAWNIWRKEGVLRSWLQDIDPSRDRDQWAVRIFTRAPLDTKKTHDTTSKDHS
ncbi:MAG: CDP-alcohol phosphatidyltransferase family protein [Nitrosomonas sp.]|nr:CDP-alcohol phosphatidyltransferase family protein [Nitrosomonas sp.]